MAHKALRKDSLYYVHEEGHGVGSFLTVHERPCSLQSSPLKPGHVITNEPGFYKEGEFGIRIESTLVVKELQTHNQKDGERWLGFEYLTHVPIQTRMVCASLLSKEEQQWIKVSHNIVASDDTLISCL